MNRTAKFLTPLTALSMMTLWTNCSSTLQDVQKASRENESSIQASLGPSCQLDVDQYDSTFRLADGSSAFGATISSGTKTYFRISIENRGGVDLSSDTVLSCKGLSSLNARRVSLEKVLAPGQAATLDFTMDLVYSDDSAQGGAIFSEKVECQMLSSDPYSNECRGYFGDVSAFDIKILRPDANPSSRCPVREDDVHGSYVGRGMKPFPSQESCQIANGVACLKDPQTCWIPSGTTSLPIPSDNCPIALDDVDGSYSGRGGRPFPTQSSCEISSGISCVQDNQTCWIPL